MENPTQPSGRKLSKVFIYASIIVGIMVVLGAVFPDRFGQVTGNVGSWVIEYFGWYYLIITTLMVFFCIFLVFSPIGKLKLGKPYHKPEFHTISWLAMLFSAGMGIGLVFYGAAEPIQHYMGPPTADPETDAAMVEALRSTFFHYGFHAWAMYGVVALALAYSQFRKGEVGLLSKTLRPILGDRVDGPIGIAVDVLSVFATIIGVAVSLGVGTLQINGGLNYLFGLPINIMVQGIIIAVVTFLFLISAWSGLSKGIQYLSNLNMGLAGILLIAVLILGPTMMILNMMNTSTGAMLDTFLYNSLDVAPLNQQKSEWLEVWTIYYWGWWMSWSPFVGIFIARVSRGRSVREFVLAVLLVPTLVSIVWFSVFGVTGIEIGKTVPAIFDMNAETMLFGIFNELPLSMVLSVIALLLVSSFFVTSADSATYVLGMQTAFGSLQPSNKIKIVWGIALSSIAFVLLLSGGDTGLAALQSAAIISAFPFSFIIISMMVSFYKDANEERKYLGLSITPNRQRMKDYIEKSKRERAEEIKAEQEAGHEHQ
ncbi:BCCT family transporter [Salinicoccus roseus]|jgi:glycine betaine transporter|uniref:BCCT family transporter n=1 Tax=Salinicoccus roseus TaxID=45670 RepID=UPI000F4D702B|nr:BCCT family transporter [Salinicoccus roseus]RPE51082.1 glycine betaine transporter [Salinicoccus roseus]GGA78147.1 glycine/betaine ABC transporter [Salinicoccus roseus]